jgi:DNA polymerase epsilon subunit 1
MFGPKVQQDEVPIPGDGPEADLEDMIGTKLNGRKNPRPVVRVYETGNEGSNLQGAPALEDGAQAPSVRQMREATPDKNEDYQAWLEHKKRKWKEARDKRRRSRLMVLQTPRSVSTFHLFKGS